MLSGVRTEPGDMGLAEEGYMDEGIEEGPGEGEGPMEGEGRTWEGGADGGSINALDRGGLEPGPCWSIQLVLGVMGSGSGEGKTAGP